MSREEQIENLARWMKSRNYNQLIITCCLPVVLFFFDGQPPPTGETFFEDGHPTASDAHQQEDQPK